MFKPEIAATAVVMVSPAEGGPAVSDIDVIDQQRLNTAAKKSKFENRVAGLSSLSSRVASATLTMARKFAARAAQKSLRHRAKMTVTVRCGRCYMETV